MIEGGYNKVETENSFANIVQSVLR